MKDLSLLEKMKGLQRPLRIWNKERFGNIDEAINNFEHEIQVLDIKNEQGDLNEVELARYEALWSQLQLWYGRKESYWRQLSKDKWLKQGDRNTRYFHAVAVERRRRKMVQKLKVGQRWMKGPQAIKREAVKFFKMLYTQPVEPRVDISEGLLPS